MHPLHVSVDIGILVLEMKIFEQIKKLLFGFLRTVSKVGCILVVITPYLLIVLEVVLYLICMLVL